VAPALAAALVGSAFAHAPKYVRFNYERQEGAAACPDASALQTGVAARLGYDPFRELAEDRLHATIRSAGSMLEARIEMMDAQGNLMAERKLVSRQRDCSELASSIELAISIAIDPMGKAQASPPSDTGSPPSIPTVPEPAHKPDPPAPVAASTPTGPSESTSPPMTGRLALALVGGFRSAPSPSVGMAIGAALRRGSVSLGLDARADLPAASSLRVGEVSSSLYLASLMPCAHYRVAAGCVLAAAGAQHVAGHNLVDARSATAPYLAFGARLGADLPLSPHMALTFYGDLIAPVTHMSLLVGSSTVWKTPALAFALGLGVAAIIP
jgi:hypothetical protein